MKILVVDDSKMNLQLASDILQSHRPDSDIITCLSGREALDVLDKQTVDVLLLDIVMPEISGIEVLQTVRSRRELDAVHIIMLTSITDKHTLKVCFEMGANDYITKPIENMEFTARLDAAIRQVKYQQNLNKAMSTLERKNNELREVNQRLRDAQSYIMRKEKLLVLGELSGGVAKEIMLPLQQGLTAAETLETLHKRVRQLLETGHRFAEWAAAAYPEDPAILKQTGEIASLEEALKAATLAEQLPQRVQELKHSVSHGLALAGSLRNVSLSDPDAEADNFLMADMVADVVHLFSHEAHFVADLETSVPEGLMVHGFREPLTQVLMYLTSNAIQAIRDTHSSKAVRGHIMIRAGLGDREVFCTVSDNGPGIPADVLRRIFEPFYSTKPTEQGTGLGLTLAQDVVHKLHGGNLTVESEPGKGAAFTFRLPQKINN